MKKLKIKQLTYNNQSTAKIKETSSAGRPMVSKTITSVTRPACGMPAAPIEAAVAVILMAKIFPNPKEIPRSWAMKIAATASY